MNGLTVSEGITRLRPGTPHARGEISELISEAFRGSIDDPGIESALRAAAGGIDPGSQDDPLYDDDLQLSLYMLYELHYQGFSGVDERWEWHPTLLSLRAELEEVFEQRLRADLPQPAHREWDAQTVSEELFAMCSPSEGPSVAGFLQRRASIEQAREFLVHKSIYQLKEADPHTWAIPRLTGRSKSALVEIQADEYGNGMPGQMHSELFAQTMEGVGLDSTPGYYIDHLPAITLASVNAMSLFGLHRRLRGAIVGHLAIYEMTSSLPNAKYSRAFAKLGFDETVLRYFDEHVEADAVHEQIAGRDLAGGLIEADPSMAPDVFFGAAAVAHLDHEISTWQLAAWEDGRTSLRVPLDSAVS